MLYLVPSPLSQKTPKLPVLAADLPLVKQCKTWLVENAKPARAALGHFNMPTPIRDLQILEIAQLNPQQRQTLIEQCMAGEPIAVMSDAGCPGVAEAAVIGVPHPKWDERPLLIVVRRPDSQVGKAEVLKFLDGKIAKWWMPDDVQFIDAIPHGATGKILKTALRKQFEDYKLPA